MARFLRTQAQRVVVSIRFTNASVWVRFIQP